MSEQFTPLSWDELLADIPTIAENEAARQQRKEAERTKRTDKAAKSKTTAPPKPGKDKKDSTAPKQEKGKKESSAPKQDKSKKESSAPKQDKVKKESTAPKQDKGKKESTAPKQDKDVKEPVVAKPEKQKKDHSKSRKGKNKGSASKKDKKKVDEAVPDQRNQISLPPVPQPTVTVEPVIDLPKVETPVAEALVIDLSLVTNDSSASESQSADLASVQEDDLTGFRWRRRRKFSPAAAEEKRPASAIIFCAIRRFLLTIFVLAGILVVGLYLVLNLIFNGPSPTARDVLTMSLSEASGTKWVPGLFLDDKLVEEIRKGDTTLLAEDEDIATLPPVEINTDTSLTANSDEWKDCPDGIRIEQVSGDTYQAYVMLVRDPSRVYLATSSDRFSKNIPGTRITDQIEKEGAIAAVNAGAFFDNGTSDPSVGSIPQGLTISKGKVVWDSGNAPEQGFVGFNQNNVLVVADTMTAEEAQALGIRDGCCFGPVLIQNGVIKNETYNSASGYNPRTAIGQRADGSVILLCIDGRQSQSIGGTYADIIDIMVEYKAVNACNLDGGSSTTMLYRDQTGRYGTAGKVHMINNYSLLQSQPRKMPTFIMVRPEGEE